MTIRKYEGSADAALERALEDAKKAKRERDVEQKDWDRIRNSQNVQQWKPRKKRRRRSHAAIRAAKAKRALAR